jgi:hypothetical protein
MQSTKFCFPISWQLECQSDSEDWILIDQQSNVSEMKEDKKIMAFTLQNEIVCSSLRFQVLESTGLGCYLKSFEIFGVIIDKDSSLQDFLLKPIKMNNDFPITFEFTESCQDGFFKFCENLSLNDRNNLFEIYSSETKSNSISQILLFWDEEEWQANNDPDVTVWILFKFPFLFQMTGYLFKAGESNFLINWEVIGRESNHGKSFMKEIVLAEQKEYQDLATDGTEKSFSIDCETFSVNLTLF